MDYDINEKFKTESDRDWFIICEYEKIIEKDILRSKQPGEFTIDDFDDMPLSKRYELYDGVPVKMESHWSIHQLIMGDIMCQLMDYRDCFKTNLRMIHGMDVQLDEEGKNVFIPDLILFHPEKSRENRILDIPEFVVEIISNITAENDKVKKLEKYKQYGVKEYWIVDPYTKSVIKNYFEKGEISYYSFDEKIPISILDNEINIFLDINAYDLEDLYDENGKFIKTGEIKDEDFATKYDVGYVDGKQVVLIKDIRFKGKRNINWKEVEKYVMEYVGTSYEIIETSDKVYIGDDFPDELKGSEDTRRLRGANAKAKANATQEIPGLLKIATNKRWQENFKKAHNTDAQNGWYRFTSRFALPIYSNYGEIERYSVFRIEMLIRHASDGNLYLYDMVNIKKETSTPLERIAVR